MGAFKKYLGSEIIEAEDIPGYTIIEPRICQSCINSKRMAEICTAYKVDVEVHPYGTCPKWRERRG